MAGGLFFIAEKGKQWRQGNVVNNGSELDLNKDEGTVETGQGGEV